VNSAAGHIGSGTFDRYRVQDAVNFLGKGSGTKTAIIVALLAVLLGGCVSDPPAPMTTVSDFDLRRYLGQWHQVAAIPAWFQSDCAARTTARYASGKNGLVEVVNACDTADGSRKQAEARARFLDSGSDGKLEVTFVEILGFWVWPAAGDYWIIGLDPEYQWSVVGTPSRDYAWILARSGTLDLHTLREIGDILRRESYDACALVMTTPGRQDRLCDVTG
jgi:apolipoprotein D and lipocalin family protein